MQADRSSAAAAEGRIDALALQRQAARVLAAPEAPWLHQEAGRRLAERLPWIKLQPARVLDWSAPSGSSEALLRQAYPQAQRTIVAAAASGDERAGAGAGALTESGAAPARPWWRRLLSGAATPVLPAHAVPPGSAELLWSNMLLHGSNDPARLFERWHAAVAVGGFLMFSTLGPGSLAELRELYARQGWGVPMAPLVDMHDYGDMLVRAGFADPVMDQETLQLSWPDAATLLRELHTLGGNVSPHRAPGLRTPRWRLRLEAALLAAAAGGRPALSVELVYGHAFRAAPRPRVQGETPISLQDMRQMVGTKRPA